MNTIEIPGSGSPQSASAVLVRRKWQVLTTFLAVLAVVTAVTLRMPKEYETRMKILVKNERADTVVSTANAPPPGYKDAVSEEQINTELELLDSSNLLRQVVEKCGLDKLEKVNGSRAGGNQAVAMEQAVTRLHKDLKTSGVRKANVIEVDYTSTDPHMAAAVLRQLADSYLEMHLRLHSTPGTYQFFANQTAAYQAQLKDAEAKLTAFRQRDNIIMLNEQKDAMLRTASESQSALLQTEAAIGEYQNKITDIRRQLQGTAQRVTTLTKTAANLTSVEHLTSMLAELKNKRTELVAKFRPDDRLVQEVDQQIADTGASIEKARKLNDAEQSTDINPIRQSLEIELVKEQAELSGLEAKRRALAQQSQGYRTQLMALSNATSQSDDLTRSQKEAEENYSLYARKAEEARISESLDRQKIANVAIAETPIEPQLPSKPNVPLNLALGGMLAGLMGLGVGFGAEYFKFPARAELAPPLAGNAMRGDSVTFEMRHLPELVEHAPELEDLTGLTVLAIVDRS